MKRQNKVLGLMLAGSLLSGAYLINESTYDSKVEKEMHRNQMNRFFNSIDEYKKDYEMSKKINNKIEEISDFKNSEGYKEREAHVKLLNQLRDKTGININDIETVNFELTYYTNLPEENGGYTVTCTGNPLEGNIVANNVIPQQTKIVLRDRLVTVADKGAESIFSVKNRLDVLAPRLAGETDQQYLDRVNDIGRVKIEGYILK